MSDSNSLYPPDYKEKDGGYESDVSFIERSRTPDRRDSESSTERSDYDSSDSQILSGPTHEYGFYYVSKAFRRDISVKEKTNSGNQDRLFADMSKWGKNPDVLVRLGSDDKGLVVSSARFRFSKNLTLKLGIDAALDEEKAGTGTVEMKNDGRFGVGGLGHHKYSLAIPGGVTGNGTGEPRKYAWERTISSKDGVDLVGKLSRLNYKFVDVQTGEVLAVYLENGRKSWLKRGKLRIKGQLSKEGEMYVLLGALGLCEKARRRAAKGFHNAV